MLITLIILILIVGGGIQLWMLIECATKEPSGNDKIVWILVILLGGCVGGLVYLIVRRPKRIAETGQ